jgi:hypothetical protein
MTWRQDWEDSAIATTAMGMLTALRNWTWGCFVDAFALAPDLDLLPLLVLVPGSGLWTFWWGSQELIAKSYCDKSTRKSLSQIK